jgi:hypothetical protein
MYMFTGRVCVPETKMWPNTVRNPKSGETTDWVTQDSHQGSFIFHIQFHVVNTNKLKRRVLFYYHHSSPVYPWHKAGVRGQLQYLCYKRNINFTYNLRISFWNPCYYVYSIYAVTKIHTWNLRYISACGQASKSVIQICCLNKIISRWEKPETTYSGLWTWPSVPANYSKECCNAVFYCN